MKIKAAVMLLSLAVLAGCGSDDDNKDGKTGPTSPYDLSKISPTCYVKHQETRDNSGQGIYLPTGANIYAYTSSDLTRLNQCSPDGTDIPSFLVNDNLLSVLAYVQDVDSTHYVFAYVLPDPATSVVGLDLADEVWPTSIAVEGTNAQGDYTIEINLELNARVFTQNNDEPVVEVYTLAQAQAEFPHMLQQGDAMFLFQLANGQEPSL
ncbi:hypothetical protein [Photobacterium sp. TY1-4]|uniref:hypothetical protein n=1 Tax=Photobacterium sp. TY1-4 TaxID=2899122 RepID=UPI0021BE3413|nr:hypothetical protein [Photobacterium sp. TY1-4]UXI01766.1 hypothetical protein NH461_02670 [Photobacterium sp. TY1-4]